MSQIERRFRKEGAVIEVHSTIPVEELSPKRVLEVLSAFEKTINDEAVKITKLQTQIKQSEDTIEETKKNSKDLNKFKSWAIEFQESKIKAVINEISQECKQAILDSYVPVEGEDNNKTMFLQYQHKIATHKRMTEEIFKDIMVKKIYEENVLENPFV
jgi:TolA-binding protein